MATGSTGRNDPCPCGSGKKFKKCHLNAPVPVVVTPSKENAPRRAMVKVPGRSMLSLYVMAGALASLRGPDDGR